MTDRERERATESQRGARQRERESSQKKRDGDREGVTGRKRGARKKERQRERERERERRYERLKINKNLLCGGNKGTPYISDQPGKKLLDTSIIKHLQRFKEGMTCAIDRQTSLNKKET